MRSNVVDYYRALAVTLVSIYHIHMGLGEGSFDLHYGFNLYAPLGNGWVGVGLFFIISGYCMGMSTTRDLNDGITFKKFIRYLMKRFFRIAPAYYISILVWFVLINYFSVIKKPTDFLDIITHITFIHNLIPETIYTINGVYWSIGVEMQFYVLLPVIISIVTTLSKRFFFLFLCVITTVFIYFSDLSHVYKIGLFNYMTLFVIGWMLYEYRVSINIFLKKTKLGFVFLLIAVIMLFYKGHGYNNNEKIFEMIVSSCFGLSMVYFVLDDKVINDNFLKKLGVLIGKASFSIYLYNYIFYAVKPIQYNLFSGFILLVTVNAIGILMYNTVEVQTEKIRKRIFTRKDR
ncbi:acyltransferase family protein [Morganella morganii]|uniref:acyltransferase family protein n=1 Tax=Morganella morganii TaxID=582 RepID=UPI00298E98D5|nr:acyltransferase [Morganella morganii]MDW7783331.1 acyltransferase [Morganella morganii]MDW7789248.1 acyltransferase [Morganella morganii]